MPDNPPIGVQRVTVRLGYRDPAQAVQFLADAFGFPERRDKRLEGKAGSIIVTEVAVGDAYIMIGPAGAHGISSPLDTGAPTESIMVYVDNIDQHFEVARSNGANIIVEPADQYWGDRRYEAKDPEGHTWFFHERTREVSEEEIRKTEASFRE